MKKLLSLVVAGALAVAGTAALAQDKKAEPMKEETKPAAAAPAKKQDTKPAATAPAKKEDAKAADAKKDDGKKKEKIGGC
jgi:Ni/Co efflux regulator RcnB